MTIVGKDRRGLGEIVTLASVLCVLGGVVITELIITKTASTELIVILAGVGAALPIRGVQSAMERGASSEQRNFESSELRQVTAELRRELEELRRTNDVNRVLSLAAKKEQG
jgi:hypothetical protein